MQDDQSFNRAPMLLIVRYIVYLLKKWVKKTGTAETVRGKSAVDIFTTLPIFFYLFSLSNAICIITKTEMTGLHWLLIAVVMIAVYVYLRKVEKKVDKEFQNISKLKKWVLSILAFFYFVIPMPLFFYTHSLL